MTTTATTTRPSVELQKLQAARDKANAPVREARDAITAFDAETERKRVELSERHRTHEEEFEPGVNGRPAPGTYAAKLRAEIRERMAVNPHQAELDKARGPYEQADLAMQTFKRERVFDRIAEVTGDVDPDGIRAAWEQLREQLELYRLEIEEVRGIVLDTPGLNGQALAYDGRVEGWYRLALEALAGADIAKPGLTPAAAAKVARNV